MTNSSFDLSGKVAIVTGGNGGIGLGIAEGLAGSEEAFALEMTARARGLGLRGSVFKNATGWPDPGHQMTARDLAILHLLTFKKI